MRRILRNMRVNLVGLGLLAVTWYVLKIPLLLQIAATVVIGLYWLYMPMMISAFGLYRASEVTREEVLARCKITETVTKLFLPPSISGEISSFCAKRLSPYGEYVSNLFACLPHFA